MTYCEWLTMFIVDGPVYIRLCQGDENNCLWEKSPRNLTPRDRHRLENAELKSMFPRIDNAEAATVWEFVEEEEQ